MSLSVHVFVNQACGEKTLLDEPPDTSNLAELESWRTDVWVSDRLRALSAEFFPQLAEHDLYVEPEQVHRFQRECALLRANLDFVTAGVDLLNHRGITVDLTAGQVIQPADSHAAIAQAVSWRLANIEAAAQRAQATSGGILIW